MHQSFIYLGGMSVSVIHEDLGMAEPWCLSPVPRETATRFASMCLTLCLISAHYSCYCRFALCSVAVCFSALSMPACVSASLCRRRMLLHDQLNRAWHACEHNARFDCRSACHCWHSVIFCECCHPPLTSLDCSVFRCSFKFI